MSNGNQPTRTLDLSIDQDRLWQRLERLAEITEPDRPQTKVAFSDLHVKGRAWQ